MELLLTTSTLFKYLVLIIIFTCAGSEKFRCDYKYSAIAEGWLKYQEIPATWFDARLRCALEGGILASPTTPGLMSVLENLLNDDGNEVINKLIFTGIHATFSKGDYYSVDEYNYDNRTNSCYKFHTVPRTFSRAFFACSAEGGHLAIINNDTEAVVIKELFSKYPASSMIGNFSKDVAFVGFTDWGEHGDWRTIHGQTLLEAGYATFAYGEPNRSPSGGEYCGSVYRNAELNDADCDESHAFICEKAPEYPAVCSNSDDV